MVPKIVLLASTLELLQLLLAPALLQVAVCSWRRLEQTFALEFCDLFLSKSSSLMHLFDLLFGHLLACIRVNHDIWILFYFLLSGICFRFIILSLLTRKTLCSISDLSLFFLKNVSLFLLIFKNSLVRLNIFYCHHIQRLFLRRMSIINWSSIPILVFLKWPIMFHLLHLTNIFVSCGFCRQSVLVNFPLLKSTSLNVNEVLYGIFQLCLNNLMHQSFCLVNTYGNLFTGLLLEVIKAIYLQFLFDLIA